MNNMGDMMNRRFLSKPPLSRPVTKPVPGSVCMYPAAVGESIPAAPPPPLPVDGQEMTELNLLVPPCVNLDAADGRNGMLNQNNRNRKYDKFTGDNSMKMDLLGPYEDFLRENLPTLEEAMENEKSGRELNPDEEKKLRRTISNRLSAQRARMKKTFYIGELKKKIRELEDEIACLSPTLKTLKQKDEMLKNQKAILEQELNRYMNQTIICNRQIEEYRVEIARLQESLLLKMEHKRMMNANEIGIPNSTLTSFPVYLPETYNLTTASSASYAGFSFERPGVSLDGMNNIDHEEIEQYLNLDALGFSPSTKPSDG